MVIAGPGPSDVSVTHSNPNTCPDTNCRSINATVLGSKNAPEGAENEEVGEKEETGEKHEPVAEEKHEEEKTEAAEDEKPE